MTTEPKWTPGPWHVGRDAEEDIGFGWFVGGGGYCRAHLVGPIKETEANARLIAQAPAMAELLQEALSDINSANTVEWEDRVYAVLAAAFGEHMNPEDV